MIYPKANDTDPEDGTTGAIWDGVETTKTR